MDTSVFPWRMNVYVCVCGGGVILPALCMCWAVLKPWLGFGGFNIVPLYMYTGLVVVIFSAEDIPPSSLYWSGPGHWGAKAEKKEKRFCISILWETYCLQNKLIAPVYLCLAPLLWKKGRAVICLIVWHIVTLQEYLTCALSVACAISLWKEKKERKKWMEVYRRSRLQLGSLQPWVHSSKIILLKGSHWEHKLIDSETLENLEALMCFLARNVSGKDRIHANSVRF